MKTSLRQQIFVWYAVLLPFIFTAMAFAAQTIMVDRLRMTVDQSLLRQTQNIADILAVTPVTNPSSYNELIDWLTEQQLPYVPTILRISDPEGNVIVTFGDVPDTLLPIMDRQLLLPEQPEGQYETAKTRGYDALRIFILPVYHRTTGEIIVFVQAGESLSTIVQAQNELWVYTLVFGLIGSLIILLTGFLVLQRGFRPLDQILRRVREIGSGNLSVRIPESTRPAELQQLADTLNDTMEQLETSFKTRENFIAGISHDLRTPLTVIQGQIDVLRMKQGVDMDTGRSLELIAREVRRLARMTGNLLYSTQLASHPAVPVGKVNLNELLAEIHREMQLFSQNVNIELALQENVITSGDYDLMKQMVLNIVDNAVKFTPQDGSVVIGLKGDYSFAYITVTDSGPGIPKEHLAHITEPFYKVKGTDKNGRGGSGLGLSIVKQIAELHHGRLDITSEEGRGTTVTVCLPLYAAVTWKGL